MPDQSSLDYCLRQIVKHDTDYDYRYLLILRAMSRAATMGLKTGYRIDPGEPEWLVAYIELPTGQVSWHMPQFPEAWDGHDTEEKFRRIDDYVNGRFERE